MSVRFSPEWFAELAVLEAANPDYGTDDWVELRKRQNLVRLRRQRRTLTTRFKREKPQP